MSYTTLKRITPEGLVVSTDFEYRNSHGFQPFVWSHMSRLYFNDPMHWLMAGMRGEAGLKSFWGLWKRQDIPMHERAVFMATFDTALFKFSDFQRMALAMQRFMTEALISTPDHACHLGQIAQDILALPEEITLGAGFYGSSVSGDQWLYDTEKTDEEEDRIIVPYDINKGTKHFFVYSELDKLPTL